MRAGGGPLDLARLLVVVPTPQSRRRLREALAEHAATHDQAEFPPRVMTPDAPISHGLRAGAATRLESRPASAARPAWAAWAAWAAVPRETDSEEFREIFPLEPPTRHATWAPPVAGQRGWLQAALGEGGRGGAATWWRAPGAIFRRRSGGGKRGNRSGVTTGRWWRSAGATGGRSSSRRRKIRRVQLCADPAARAGRIAAVARGYAQAEAMRGVADADTAVLPLAENAPARVGDLGVQPRGAGAGTRRAVWVPGGVCGFRGGGGRVALPRCAGVAVGALDLLGWLELLRGDAPHVVVAGVNDGRVPDAIVDDMFLPEALRGRLGLKTNVERPARDASLLAALAAWRHGEAGRLEVLAGKTSGAGDPLRSSRQLLRCTDGDLPGRVRQRFREVAAEQPTLPWARALRLRPRDVPAPAKVSVPALRDWLACPFRFRLRRALRLDRADPAKAGLEARDFGPPVPDALQQLGESEELADCADAPRLREFLPRRFERVARLRYGADLALPPVGQLESARRRRASGRPAGAPWRWSGNFRFRSADGRSAGKIDRIDRCADGACA